MATTKKTEKIVKAAEPVVTAKAEEKKIETAAPAAEAPKTEVKAAEAPKAEKKPVEKKSAAKKAAAPAKKAEKPAAAKKAEKPAAEKKAAAKSEKVVLQFGDKEINIDDIVANCKAAYKNGTKKQVKTIEVYVKPEDSKAYYVINGKEASSIDL